MNHNFVSNASTFNRVRMIFRRWWFAVLSNFCPEYLKPAFRESADFCPPPQEENKHHSAEDIANLIQKRALAVSTDKTKVWRCS